MTAGLREERSMRRLFTGVLISFLIAGVCYVVAAQEPESEAPDPAEQEALGLSVVDTIALTSETAEGEILVKRGFFRDLITKGGDVMWALLAVSLFGIALVVERFLALRRSKILPGAFLKKVKTRWLKGDIKGAFEICEENDIPISRVLKAGLAKHSLGLSEVERAIEGTGGHEVQSLSKHLRALGALSSIAPLLGILGTVIGMIKAFNVIAVSGSRRPDLIASGISQALITTAAGLCIGIPLFLLYHYLRGRVDQLTWEMEELALDIVENLALGSEEIAL
jgi:biopolymer transport protein ExbB